jgi:hypothetical protein
MNELSPGRIFQAFQANCYIATAQPISGMDFQTRSQLHLTMFSKLFKKKPAIPPTWLFLKEDNVSLIDSFVNQVKEQLLQSFPDGQFEYEDGFVEFYVQRVEALYRFRFEIKKWTPQAIEIKSLGLWMAFDRLEVRDGVIPGYEDRYYRLVFGIDDILCYTALEDYTFHPFETRNEADFSLLFNELGFL